MTGWNNWSLSLPCKICATDYLKIAVVITITIQCSEDHIAGFEFRVSEPASDWSLEQMMEESTTACAI